MKNVFYIFNPQQYVWTGLTILKPLLNDNSFLVCKNGKWTWWVMDGIFGLENLRVINHKVHIRHDWKFAVVKTGEYTRRPFLHMVSGRPMRREHVFDYIQARFGIRLLCCDTNDIHLEDFVSSLDKIVKSIIKEEAEDVNNEHLKNLLEKEIFKFRSFYDNGHDPNVSSYFTINSSGDVFSNYGMICHADMFSQIGKRVCIYDEVRAYYKQSNDPLSYAEYVDYLMTKSVFKECFLPRTLDEVLDSGVLYDPNAPGMMVYAAAIMLRQPAEFANQLPSMRWFADNLTEGDWIGAWVMAQMVAVDKYRKPFSRIYWDNRHKIFGENFSVKQVASFFKNGYKERNKTPAATWNGNDRWALSNNLLDQILVHGENPNFEDLEVKKAAFGERNVFNEESVKFIWNKFKEFGYA